MTSLAYTLLLAHLATLPTADQQNVCLSPYSLQSAFALVQEGAKGQTKKEITGKLHTQDFVSLPDASITDGEGVVFEQANSIWINSAKAPKINDSFLNINRKKYHAEVTSLAFGTGAQQQINDWCSQKTHGRIPTAIDKLNPDEVMELINAIYFKGSWVTAFQPRATRMDDFYTPTLTDDPIQVSMMRNTTRFYYAENEVCQFIELPFTQGIGQDEYALQVVLPKEGTTLLQLDQLLADGYQLPQLQYCKVKLSLPKFELNYSADLIPTLQNMGIRLPFTAKANFKRISKAALQISTVTQKTFFKVDEQGAEAAAVTAIGMMLTSAAPRPEQVYEMNVNHPFLVQLVNKTRDVKLFVGNIFRPEAGNAK